MSTAELISDIIRDIAELEGSYSGPDSDYMVVTADELRVILERHLAAPCGSTVAAPAAAVELSPETVGNMAYMGNSVSYWRDKALAYKDRVGEAFENGRKAERAAAAPEGLTDEQIQEVIDFSSTYDPAPSVPDGIDLHEFARKIYALRPASDDSKTAAPASIAAAIAGQEQDWYYAAAAALSEDIGKWLRQQGPVGAMPHHMLLLRAMVLLRKRQL